jgi:hypothetical protein
MAMPKWRCYTGTGNTVPYGFKASVAPSVAAAISVRKAGIVPLRSVDSG